MAVRVQRADVSSLAGMAIDKFVFHPLYRQHRRLQDSGFRLSRSWLTTLMQQTVALLEPIYEVQLESIRASRVVTMDETPIKAVRSMERLEHIRRGERTFFTWARRSGRQ